MEQWNNLNSHPKDADIFDCMMMVIKLIYSELDPWIITDNGDGETSTIYGFLQSKYIREYMEKKNLPLDYLKRTKIKKIYVDMLTAGFQPYDHYKKTPLRHLKTMLEFIFEEVPYVSRLSAFSIGSIVSPIFNLPLWSALCRAYFFISSLVLPLLSLPFYSTLDSHYYLTTVLQNGRKIVEPLCRNGSTVLVLYRPDLCKLPETLANTAISI